MLTKVNDQEFSLSLSLVMLIFWHDPRLEFLPTNVTLLPVDSSFVDKIWIPDVQIGPLISMSRKQSFNGHLPGMFGVSLLHSTYLNSLMFSELVVRERQANYVPNNLAGKKTLTLVKEIDLELACEMDFYQYPLY